MSFPLSLEDLAKLKSFVEFVAANPAVLNMPQLAFFKKLIEQFGGVVPEGKFEIPTGANCPFGGNIKSESKFTYDAVEDEDEVHEMETESEESEVGRDTEVHIKVEEQEYAGEGDCEFNYEHNMMKNKLEKVMGKNCTNNDPNDALYTSELDIKCEVVEDTRYDSNECDPEEEEQENDGEGENCEDEYEDDDDDDDDYDDDGYDDDHYDDNGNEAEEDQLLMLLTRRKGTPCKKFKELDDEKVKAPRSVICRNICKQQCTEKFSEKQRRSICDHFWNLSKEDRLSFIRNHTRVKRLTRMKRVNASRSRGNNCCYYLKNYSIGSDETTLTLSTDLTRVCRKFFEATLCTTSQYIKKANDCSIQEIEKNLLLLHEIKMAKEKEKNKEPQKILDPEIGNLIILDLKESSTQNPKPPQDERSTKKRIHRKPCKPLPQHTPKPIECAQRCIHKCHIKFTEEKRKEMCDFFWSMDYKRRKDFILANIEIKDIETETTPDFRKTNRPPRAYQTSFYMRSGGTRGERLRVCKDFYVKTLCITRYFIKNAIDFADKTTGYYTGTDGRGVRGAPTKVSDERKQTVLDHIESYPYWIPNEKSRTKYLHYSLTIKKMYEAYKEKCLSENVDFVGAHHYYKVFHAHFHLLFLSNPQPKKGGGFLKANPNISHYTGEEAGGCWIDSKGNKLDLCSFNPGQTLDTYASTYSPDSSRSPSPFASGSAAQALNALPLKSVVHRQQHPSLTMVRSDINPTSY